MSNTLLKGLSFGLVYVDDFATAFQFYHDFLGLEVQHEMGEDACFFKLGESSGLYLEGKNEPTEITPNTVRASFVLAVHSASELFDKLTSASVKTVQTSPMDMGGGDFWFQFYDPAGNILGVLGGK